MKMKIALFFFSSETQGTSLKCFFLFFFYTNPKNSALTVRSDEKKSCKYGYLKSWNQIIDCLIIKIEVDKFDFNERIN